MGPVAQLVFKTSAVVQPTARSVRLRRRSVSGQEIVNEERECPMCGGTKWLLLDGHSTLQALEGGLEALAFSCDECGFIRWHRMDKAEQA